MESIVIVNDKVVNKCLSAYAYVVVAWTMDSRLVQKLRGRFSVNFLHKTCRLFKAKIRILNENIFWKFSKISSHFLSKISNLSNDVSFYIYEWKSGLLAPFGVITSKYPPTHSFGGSRLSSVRKEGDVVNSIPCERYSASTAWRVLTNRVRNVARFMLNTSKPVFDNVAWKESRK